MASLLLPGRPRWCVFDRARDRFLVNIREPAGVVGLAGGTGDTVARIDVSAHGPHGLDLDLDSDRAFVACDAGTLVVLDLERDCEVGSMAIGGEPDAIWFNAQRELLYVAIGARVLRDWRFWTALLGVNLLLLTPLAYRYRRNRTAPSPSKLPPRTWNSPGSAPLPPTESSRTAARWSLSVPGPWDRKSS